MPSEIGGPADTEDPFRPLRKNTPPPSKDKPKDNPPKDKK